MSSTLHPMLNVAVRAARAAGAIINRAALDVEAVRVAQKQVNDFVTEVDQASEEAIIETLLAAYPAHGILAEESGRAHGNSKSEFQWIIDPLDGTTNFIHGFPVYCVSIGLQVAGRMEQAVIYDPTRNDLFTATRGRGAYLNDRRIRVSKRTHLADCLIATGFPFRPGDDFPTYLKMMSCMMGATAGLRRPGAAALDLAYVAAGFSDGFFETGLKPWDVAAGSLLVTEAGGLVGNFAGDALQLEVPECLAANPRVYAQMVNMLAQYSKAPAAPAPTHSAASPASPASSASPLAPRTDEVDARLPDDYVPVALDEGAENELATAADRAEPATESVTESVTEPMAQAGFEPLPAWDDEPSAAEDDETGAEVEAAAEAEDFAPTDASEQTDADAAATLPDASPDAPDAPVRPRLRAAPRPAPEDETGRRPDRFDRQDRPDRFNRFERPGRPDRAPRYGSDGGPSGRPPRRDSGDGYNRDRPYNDRPRNDRPYGDRPYNNNRPYNDRPYNDRPYGQPGGRFGGAPGRPDDRRRFDPSAPGDRPAFQNRPPRPAPFRPFNDDRPRGNAGGNTGGYAPRPRWEDDAPRGRPYAPRDNAYGPRDRDAGRPGGRPPVRGAGPRPAPGNAPRGKPYAPRAPRREP